MTVEKFSEIQGYLFARHSIVEGERSLCVDCLRKTVRTFDGRCFKCYTQRCEIMDWEKCPAFPVGR